MSYHRLLVVLLALFAFQSASAAEGLSYTHVTVGYNNLEFGGDEDFNGYSFALSLRTSENNYLFASTTDLDSDDEDEIAGEEVNVSSTRLGFGIIFGINDALDINGTVAFVNQDGDDALDIADDDGFEIGVGVRSLVGERFELGGSITHQNLNDVTATNFEAYGRYFVRSAISAGLTYQDADDISGPSFDIRIDF